MKHQKINSLAEIIAHIGGDAFNTNFFKNWIFNPFSF